MAIIELAHPTRPLSPPSTIYHPSLILTNSVHIKVAIHHAQRHIVCLSSSPSSSNGIYQQPPTPCVSTAILNLTLGFIVSVHIHKVQSSVKLNDPSNNFRPQTHHLLAEAQPCSSIGQHGTHPHPIRYLYLVRLCRRQHGSTFLWLGLYPQVYPDW